MPRYCAVLSGIHLSGGVGRSSCASKKISPVMDSVIVHCRPLLAIAAVASVAHRQKMPANSASLACWPVLPPRRDRSCAYKIGVSRLVQCPVSAYSMYSRSAVEADCVAFSIALPGASGHRKLYSWLSKSLHVLTTFSLRRGCGRRGPQQPGLRGKLATFNRAEDPRVFDFLGRGLCSPWGSTPSQTECHPAGLSNALASRAST